MPTVKGYTVSIDKNGYYYSHRIGYPNIPVFGSFSKKKKHALQISACSMGMLYNDYMEWRKKYSVK